MCECGCVEGETRYTLPGPEKSFYVVALYGGCVDCDAPAGITIEEIKPSHTLYKGYEKEFTDGSLKLKKWRGSRGVAITTGLTKREFVKAVESHLIGVQSKEFSEGGDKIDKFGAEAILEEMYDDSTVKPHVAKGS
jgi:hypothetical protein